MSVILKRLVKTLSIQLKSDQSVFDQIKNHLASSAPELVILHAQINIEYSILCSKIAYEYSSPPAQQLKTQIEEALQIAELLEMIYRDYLDVPREIERLNKEQRLMSAYLSDERRNLQAETQTLYVSKWVRDQSSYINLPRLFAVRARRVLMAIVPLTDTASYYHQSMQAIDQYAAPFFSHLAWLYFIPRIANHLVMIIKHTFEHGGMTVQEKALGWPTRLKIQLQARWPDLSNDLPWMIANSVSCFVLIGPLLPYNIILSICMQFYEIAQATCQYYIELNHLYQQRDDYISMRDLNLKDTEEYRTIDTYIVHLNKRIDYETNRLLIPIVNTTVLLLAIILAAPVFTPGYAVAGGVIAVTSTIGAYAAKKYVESERPPGNLFQLLNNPPCNDAEALMPPIQ